MSIMETNEIKEFISYTISKEMNDIKKEISDLKIITIRDSNDFGITMKRDEFFQLLYDRGSLRFSRIVKHAWDWQRIIQFIITFVTFSGMVLLFLKG